MRVITVATMEEAIGLAMQLSSEYTVLICENEYER